MQHRRSFALVGAEIGVARRQSEAIRFANDGADHDFGVEVQVAHHLRNQPDLLRVFAAEVSEIGLDNFE